MIELYYWPTPNGKKVTIFLEEADVPYRITPVNILAGDQFKPEYLALNPNHRMPTLVDHAPSDGGAPLAVFESGAILMYLAEKYGRFWPQAPRPRYAAAQWLVWQMANFGAKIGEFNHFNRLDGGAGDQSYALTRFASETNRLYGVLNWGLSKSRYLAGDEYGIADMAVFPWANNWSLHGQDLGEFKHVARWLDELGVRPALRRGMDVGKELVIDPSTFSPEALERLKALLFNQRAIPIPE